MRVTLILDVDRHGVPVDQAIEIILNHIPDFMVWNGSIVEIDEKRIDYVQVNNARKSHTNGV